MMDIAAVTHRIKELQAILRAEGERKDINSASLLMFMNFMDLLQGTNLNTPTLSLTHDNEILAVFMTRKGRHSMWFRPDGITYHRFKKDRL